MQALPTVSNALAFDRSAVAAGHTYRLLTAQLTHWSWSHLAWDLLVLITAGSACERRDRPLFLGCLAAALVVLPMTLLVVDPGLDFYRGLSGIDASMFVLLAGHLIREGLSQRRPLKALVTGAWLVGFAGKIAYEYATGATVFVDGSTAQAVPLAHVVGAAVGFAFWPVRRRPTH